MSTLSRLIANLCKENQLLRKEPSNAKRTESDGNGHKERTIIAALLKTNTTSSSRSISGDLFGVRALVVVLHAMYAKRPYGHTLRSHAVPMPLAKDSVR